MCVNNGTEDNIVVDEVLVEGLGWKVYIAQCLFEENVGKTGKVWSTNFKCERFGSCIYARGRY